MELKLPKLQNRQDLNSFIKVEPDVSFGSFGALCLKCHQTLSSIEYMTISWVDPKVGPVTFGYTTENHKCKANNT